MRSAPGLRRFLREWFELPIFEWLHKYDGVFDCALRLVLKFFFQPPRHSGGEVSHLSPVFSKQKRMNVLYRLHSKFVRHDSSRRCVYFVLTRFFEGATVNSCRPLRRRRASTARPFLVDMRSRKPWVRARLIFLSFPNIGKKIVR